MSVLFTALFPALSEGSSYLLNEWMNKATEVLRLNPAIVVVQSLSMFMSDSLWPHGLQHARLPCPSLSPTVCSNSCPWSWWCHPSISSSIALFSSSCPQSFPASGSFPMSWLFSSSDQSIGNWASVLPLNIQSWFPLRLTGLISLQSKGLSRVFSSTTVWKHQLSFMLNLLYGPTLTSIHDYWKSHSFDCLDLCWQIDVSAF